jgi:predicted regulator of Ras-like GTPase activity (Roadblock/LC7/MglB family)
MTQHWMVAGKEAALTLSLGKVRQMVIVGHEHKLALFVIGQLAVGILSPSAVVLGRALAH